MILRILGTIFENYQSKYKLAEIIKNLGLEMQNLS